MLKHSRGNADALMTYSWMVALDTALRANLCQYCSSPCDSCCPPVHARGGSLTHRWCDVGVMLPVAAVALAARIAGATPAQAAAVARTTVAQALIAARPRPLMAAASEAAPWHCMAV
jgi:hypothetical protein